MKTVFVTIARGSLIRNFFRTGVIERLLKKNIRVVVLAPFHGEKKYFADFAHPNLTIEPLMHHPWSLRTRVMQELLVAAVFNSTVRARYKYQIAVTIPPSRALYVPRVYVFPLLRFVPGFRKIIQFLDFVLVPQHEHDYLFEQYRPDLVFSTNPQESGDIGVLKSARRFRVRTVGMPKSWDNLSKILFNVKTDHLIVWSPFMKEQATRLQGFRTDSVTIAGVPQFDRYAQSEHLLSRKAFCKRHQLDPHKKIILYGSSGADMCDEAAFVERIERFIDAGELSNVQILIRPHTGYKADAARFARVAGHASAVLDQSDRQDTVFKDNWDISRDHLDNLYNSLHHADVCVNVASTLTIDALANGTETINLRFDVDPNVDRKSRSVQRLFESDYIKAIVRSRATWVVEDEAAFLSALQHILMQGAHKKREIDQFIKHFAYKVDGQSAERIAQTLTAQWST